MEDSFTHMWRASRWRRFFRMKKPVMTEGGFGFFTNTPHFRQRYFYRRQINALRNARHYAYFTAAYIIPDRRFLRVMRQAAGRGVDVRILTGHKSDLNFIDAASNSHFDWALRHGIRIYRYQNDILHAKTAVIDDAWSTIGSSNLDNWSFKFNHEANIISTSPAFAADLRKIFLADIEQSKEITLSEWRQRPVKQRILEWLSMPFHKFM